jgi:hypothetical protein
LTEYSAVLSCLYAWRERGEGGGSGREGEKEKEPTETVIRWHVKPSSSFQNLLYEKSEFTLWRFN